MSYIQVIVSPCRWNGESWVLCGSRVHESKHTDPSEALQTAMSLRGLNLSVIIRPEFNEGDSYREWRSFNGKTFREIRFYLGWKDSEAKEVADADLVLPEVP